jgi:hypothetical protein
MKTKIAISPDLEDILLEGFGYLLWLVNILVCVAALFQIGSIVNTLWIMFGGDRYTLTLVNQVWLLLGGFIAFVYVMVLYGDYRECARRVRQPVKASAALGTPILDPGRPASRPTESRVVALLRRFAVTTAIPLGLAIFFRILAMFALSTIP